MNEKTLLISKLLYRGNQWASFLIGMMLVIPTSIWATWTDPTTHKTDRPSPLMAPGQMQTTSPLRVNPANPRYFMDGSGNTIYLTGSHTWTNLQDYGASNPPPVLNYQAHLDFLQAHNHNFIRLWAWEQTRWAPWASDFWFTPSPYQRTGPGTAQDGQPKFDVTRFNQAYFDRLRSRVMEAGNRGIYVSVMLFEGWSVGKKSSDDPGNPWPGHPFHTNNNINGVNADPNGDGNGYESHTLAIPAVTARQEAYVRKVIDTLNDLDNVLYEISNESNPDSTAWQYHMINYIKSYEASKPKQHLVGMTVAYPGGNNNDLFNSPADWISPNSADGYQDNPPAASGDKVIITDTDHLWGIGGDRRWVWKSFTRGLHPIFMDCYNSDYCGARNPNDPTWVSLRLNMGYTLTYAKRMNLTAMTPRSELCSTGYCLANPVATGAEYLVYLPSGGRVDVDLSASPIDLSVEWFNPENGTTVDAPMVLGGDIQTFSAPFSEDAVLYVYGSDPSSTPSAGCQPTNIALDQSATSSSTETADLTPNLAIDGKPNTRWASTYSDPQWVQVDLGSPQNICQVKLNWETAYGSSYQIQVSNDATNWTTVYSTTSGNGGTDDLTILSGSGRYVRMYGATRATDYGYSLWEFEVYSSSSSPTPTPTSTPTSTPMPTNTQAASTTPAPSPNSTPLPCAQGFLALSGLTLLAVVGSKFFIGKRWSP